MKQKISRSSCNHVPGFLKLILVSDATQLVTEAYICSSDSWLSLVVWLFDSQLKFPGSNPNFCTSFCNLPEVLPEEVAPTHTISIMTCIQKNQINHFMLLWIQCLLSDLMIITSNQTFKYNPIAQSKVPQCVVYHSKMNTA